MLGDHVDLQVDRVAHLLVPEGGELEGGRDQPDLEVVGTYRGDGERNPVDGDRALLHHVPAQPVGQREPHRLPVLAGGTRDDGGDAVDVALDQVAAQPGGQGRGSFEVDRVVRAQDRERRTVERLLHDVGGEPAAVDLDHGQTDAVDGDRVAVPGVRGDGLAADGQPGTVVAPADDAAKLLDDAGEHAGCLLRAGAPATKEDQQQEM